MLRNRLYKNKLKLREDADPTERRENLTKEELRNSTFFPNPITYEDIDQAMFDWSDNTLDLSFEGKKIPTVALYTNQRFEEYMQEWENSDEKHNMLMNFKTITRENNPKKGSINGNNSNNIPGDRFYTMRREKIIDRNGQESYIDYKMKQPFAVDLTYTINLITGKYELINDFNLLVQDIFKSGYSYLDVNGHKVYMKMEDPNDESEYSIDDRRYFAQKVKITVKSYIIQKEDFEIEEIPVMKVTMLADQDKGFEITAEEDDENVIAVDGLYYKPLSLDVNCYECGYNEMKTKLPYKMVIQRTEFENIQSCRIYIDGEVFNITEDTELEIPENTIFRIKVKRINPIESSKIIFKGYDKDVIFDEEDVDNGIEGEELYL